jgi:hypothetical protein
MTTSRPLAGSLVLLGNTVLRFQSDAAAAPAILQQLKRAPFAAQPLTIATRDGIRLLRADQIVRIDLDLPWDPEFGPMDTLPADVRREEIDAERYEEWVADREASDQDRKALARRVDDPLRVIAHLRTNDARNTYIAYRMNVPPTVEQHRYLTHYFEMAAIAYERIDGGLSLINPRQIAVATYLPGADPTPSTWRATATSVRSDVFGRSAE